VRLEKQFDVKCGRKEALEILGSDATLIELFPNTETEIIERTANRRTTRTRYKALGREGIATFHFLFEPDGNLRFEKVCDGRIWRELKGLMKLEARGTGTRVRIEMEGKTKTLIPEFTIRGPMQEQIDQMAAALRAHLNAKRK